MRPNILMKTDTKTNLTLRKGCRKSMTPLLQPSLMTTRPNTANNKPENTEQY